MRFTASLFFLSRMGAGLSGALASHLSLLFICTTLSPVLWTYVSYVHDWSCVKFAADRRTDRNHHLTEDEAVSYGPDCRNVLKVELKKL